MRLNFKLDCGRSVSVDAFYSQRKPYQQINDFIISRCLTETTPLWGRQKVHIVPPRIDESNANHPTLPPVRYTAWLTSREPISEGNDGSALVVVWFRDECSEDEPLMKILYDGIRTLPWDELAGNVLW